MAIGHMLKDKFKLFIFDLDGTLIDSQIDILNSVNHVRSLLKLPPLELSKVRSYIGNGANILVQKILPGANQKELANAFVEFKNYYYKHPVENTKIYSGILELLEKLKGKKKAVLTNKPENISKKILESLNLDSYFSLVWGGDTGPKKKPDPGPIHSILKRFKLEPKDAIMIGDGINDIRAAKSAGVATLALGYGYTDEKEILDLRPDYFSKTIKDLLEMI
ncbi:MAG: HAD-IA family hydrolase [Elusimicrobia bacterium]|nr:HAD-IA family hydrolase [Elusimicrobiota bacterium]